MNEIKRASAGFAQVKNEVLFDPTISLKAKGMFAYLYAKPDVWDFSGDRIAKEMKEGRGAVYSTLRELEDAGYLNRDKKSNGRVIYRLSWDKKPDDQIPHLATEPVDENRKLQKPQVAETVSISNTDSDKYLSNINTDLATPSVAEGYSFQSALEKFRESDDKRVPILAEYFEAKGYQFQNKDQHVAAVQRNIRAAKLLVGYPIDQVRQTMDHLNLNADFKWTLETVGKYIDERTAVKPAVKAPEVEMATFEGQDLGFSLT